MAIETQKDTLEISGSALSPCVEWEWQCVVGLFAVQHQLMERFRIEDLKQASRGST